MQTFFRKSLALLGWIISAGLVSGQAPDPVKAELITLGWEANVSNLWFMSKEGPRELNAYERGFSSPEQYIGPPEIAFYGDRTALSLPPEKRPTPIALAKLSPKGGQFLLILSRKPAADEGWDVRVIDNSAANFPAGAYRVMNLTKLAVQVALDKKITPLAGPGVTIINPSAGASSRDISFGVAVGNEVVYSSAWGYRDTRRTTVFIVTDPESRGGINVRRFYQAVIPSEQAELEARRGAVRSAE